MSFPKDFMWGAASASYQIEGGAFEDGKGPSIWDVFSHTPGKIFGEQNGDISCDSYHRYEDDLDILEELHLKHYRFSISWPRVIPQGSGEINAAGLAYYDKVVDGCLARGIEPWITLYHWDLPQALQEKGGWSNREIVDDFAAYATVIAEHFGNRVKRFMTINESQCIVGMGHGSCLHAPGIPLSEEDMFLPWHNILLAHGAACKVIRKIVPDSIIGIASTGSLHYTADYDSKYTDELLETSFLTQGKEGWHFNHQWIFDPICFGSYPEDPLHPWDQLKDSISEEDLRLIQQPIDFIGLNVYNGKEMTPIADDSEKGYHLELTPKYPGYPRTALKWPITPEVMYWGPKLLNLKYKLPVVISENGLSCNDKIYLDGQVHDPDRQDFLHRYLYNLKKGIESGNDVIAYLHWSLTDNMEWHSGYDDRFGLAYVDYRTCDRIIKDSGRWYGQVAKSNGEIL